MFCILYIMLALILHACSQRGNLNQRHRDAPWSYCTLTFPVPHRAVHGLPWSRPGETVSVSRVAPSHRTRGTLSGDRAAQLAHCSV